MPLAIFSVLLDRFLDVIIFVLLAFPSFLFITRAATGLPALVISCFFSSWVFSCWSTRNNQIPSPVLFSMAWGLIRIFQLRVPLLKNWISPKGGLRKRNVIFNESSVFQIMGWNCIKYIFLSLRFSFTGLALGVHIFSHPGGSLYSFQFNSDRFINITPARAGSHQKHKGLRSLPPPWGFPNLRYSCSVFGQRILLMATLLCLVLLNHLLYFVQSKWREVGSFE